MMIMRVLVVELLCQTAKEHILVFKCLLSCACGHQRLRHVLSGIKWPPPLEDPSYLRRVGNPQVWLSGAWVCAEPGHKEELKWANKW
jgi:hypothetical protein